MLLARSSASRLTCASHTCSTPGLRVVVPKPCSAACGKRQHASWAPAHGRPSCVVAAAEPGADPLLAEEPETAQEGITLGLKLTEQGRWEDACNVFEKSLNLPGTGVKRFRDKPRQASDRERMTCLYNIACCHSRMNDVRSGLVALAGCLELGYADYAQLRRDPDLATLRTDERFEGLIRRFEPQPLTGFLGGLFGNKKRPGAELRVYEVDTPLHGPPPSLPDLVARVKQRLASSGRAASRCASTNSLQACNLLQQQACYGSSHNLQDCTRLAPCTRTTSSPAVQQQQQLQGARSDLPAGPPKASPASRSRLQSTALSAAAQQGARSSAPASPQPQQQLQQGSVLQGHASAQPAPAALPLPLLDLQPHQQHAVFSERTSGGSTASTMASPFQERAEKQAEGYDHQLLQAPGSARQEATACNGEACAAQGEGFGAKGDSRVDKAGPVAGVTSLLTRSISQLLTKSLSRKSGGNAKTHRRHASYHTQLFTSLANASYEGRPTSNSRASLEAVPVSGPLDARAAAAGPAAAGVLATAHLAAAGPVAAAAAGDRQASSRTLGSLSTQVERASTLDQDPTSDGTDVAGPAPPYSALSAPSQVDTAHSRVVGMPPGAKKPTEGGASMCSSTPPGNTAGPGHGSAHHCSSSNGGGGSSPSGNAWPAASRSPAAAPAAGGTWAVGLDSAADEMPDASHRSMSHGLGPKTPARDVSPPRHAHVVPAGSSGLHLESAGCTDAAQRVPLWGGVAGPAASSTAEEAAAPGPRKAAHPMVLASTAPHAHNGPAAGLRKRIARATAWCWRRGRQPDVQGGAAATPAAEVAVAPSVLRVSGSEAGHSGMGRGSSSGERRGRKWQCGLGACLGGHGLVSGLTRESSCSFWSASSTLQPLTAANSSNLHAVSTHSTGQHARLDA